jgi:hypothetical protein
LGTAEGTANRKTIYASLDKLQQEMDLKTEQATILKTRIWDLLKSNRITDINVEEIGKVSKGTKYGVDKMKTFLKDKFDFDLYQNASAKDVRVSDWNAQLGKKYNATRPSSFYEDTDRIMVIKPLFGVENTVTHEFAHWMENRIKGADKFIKDFYDRRTAGEKEEWLGPGYAKNEMTKRDRWFSTYAGKVPSGMGRTEVLSMGLEAMYKDPVKFYLEDREHFEVVVKVLKGAVK